MHNVSTQFADGGEFGFGGEIGISTNKLPPRGPVGINQLTSYKYVVSEKVLLENRLILMYIKKKDLVILGGSFDPPHKGHLEISKISIKKINLKKFFGL